MRRELFVDANGGYGRKQALGFAEPFADARRDVVRGAGLVRRSRWPTALRDRGPASMEIAAGEYGYRPLYFRRMLEAGAVDVLQADASRCGGITGFLKAADLCEAFGLPLSAHCAQHFICILACATTAEFRHLEYFHDHARIEAMLFDGAIAPGKGSLRPDLSRPGLGLEFKHADAERFKVWARRADGRIECEAESCGESA